MSGVYNVKWPARVMKIYEQTSKINLNILNVGFPSVTFACVQPVSFFDSWRVMVAGPLLMIVFLVLFMSIGYYFFMRGGTNTSRMRYVDKCWTVLMYLVYLVYPAVSRSCLDLYNCEMLDDEIYYLRVDYNIQVSSPAPPARSRPR